MEETTSIQLQFRTGDDLFNNYGFGIIRQVVDKSEITINQKKEEMRQLVGSKYLDMIRVSDTMSEMNDEFGMISNTVKDILSLYSTFHDDFVYIEEQSNEEDLVVTPELLWKYYDSNDMVTLCKKLHQYKSQDRFPLDSLSSEMIDDFPRIAAEKCVELIRLTPDLSDEGCMRILVPFIVFINPSEINFDFTIRQLLQIAEDQTMAALESQSLDSLLQSIQELARLFHSFHVFLTSSLPLSSLIDLLPSLPEDWSQQSLSTLKEMAGTWLDRRFTALEKVSSMVVKDVTTIAQLADMKRHVAKNHDEIAMLWESACRFLSLPSSSMWNTRLPHLYDHLFNQPSRTLIRSSFQTLQESVCTSVRRLGEYSLQEVNEFLSKWLVKPLVQLFVDLGDLDYQSSEDLTEIVEEESLSFFSQIEKVFGEIQISSPSIYLSYAYTFFLVENSAKDLMASYHVQLTSSITTFHSLFEECVKKWIASLLTPEAALMPTFRSIKWTMRDHEWLASVNGWKEFSLGTAGGIDTLGLGSEGEELEEEKVYVPGTALPALVELLLSLCRLIDMTTALTPDMTFIYQTKSVAVKSTYCAIALFYQKMVEEILDKHPILASPGLLLLLFDIHFLQTLFTGAQDIDGIQPAISTLISINELLLTTIDPVDWTLAESYMEISLNEFVAGMALLISPLLAPDYNPSDKMTMKSLAKNANILFTPMEKIASYPVSSQPMQLLLQSQMKGL